MMWFRDDTSIVEVDPRMPEKHVLGFATQVIERENDGEQVFIDTIKITDGKYRVIIYYLSP